MADHDEAQREIRKIAYDLWMKEGQPAGRDRDHWTTAKEIWAFRTRNGTVPVAESDGDAAEPVLAVENQAVQPELTDQAERTNAPRRDRAPARAGISRKKP